MPKMIERIVSFSVNGEPMQSFLCTPDALEELAVGFLLTQGHIQGIDDILSIAIEELSISVKTRGPLRPLLPTEARVQALRASETDDTLSISEAKALIDALLRVDTFYGTHCLALQTKGRTYFREDIGRHNAMDKIIGRGAMDGIDFSRCTIAATGRISLEMLLKAATVRVPFIVSKKYPSDLSETIANRLRICIIGKALSEAPVVYSAAERIKL